MRYTQSFLKSLPDADGMIQDLLAEYYTIICGDKTFASYVQPKSTVYFWVKGGQNFENPTNRQQAQFWDWNRMALS